MSAVPYTFAGNTGNIPLIQLDINFANVKAFADTAGYVTANAQTNITSLGILTALTVSGPTAINSATANTITTKTITTNTLIANSATVNHNTTVGGDIVIFGNATINGTTTTVSTQTLTVADKTITVANNVSTSALINGAGIVAGSPTVAYIKYSDITKGWTTANNFNITGNTTSGNLTIIRNTTSGNLTISGTTTLIGNATAITQANTSSNNQIATTAFVRNIVPTGIITLWYGLSSSIPDGWYLCDGTNGTPDLRDRFIVGAGNTYSVNQTGGSADATLVSHSHSFSGNDLGSHTHTMLFHQTSKSNNATPYMLSSPINGENQNGDLTLTSSSTSAGTPSGSISTAGSSATNANLPPYYALAYIMKA